MNWLEGAVGFVKAVVGIDRADDITILTRRAFCVRCPKRHKNKCVVCKCYLAEKTVVASQNCPLGKW